MSKYYGKGFLISWDCFYLEDFKEISFGILSDFEKDLPINDDLYNVITSLNHSCAKSLAKYAEEIMK